MNLHVIFVHFPVAFFTLYAVLELLRFKKLTSQQYWFYVKAVTVIVGMFGAFAALLTGDAAANVTGIRMVARTDAVVRATLNWHENFADITVTIFGIIAAVYLISWIAKDHLLPFLDKFKLWQWLINIANWFLSRSWVMVTLAVLGLISVTITGGLGGILAFGDQADPFFAFFYHLFIK